MVDSNVENVLPYPCLANFLTTFVVLENYVDDLQSTCKGLRSIGIIQPTWRWYLLGQVEEVLSVGSWDILADDNLIGCIRSFALHLRAAVAIVLVDKSDKYDTVPLPQELQSFELVLAFVEQRLNRFNHSHTTLGIQLSLLFRHCGSLITCWLL
jgi:hypothetical protein